MSVYPPGVATVLARLEADAAAYVRAARVHLDVVAYQDRPFSHVVRIAVTPSPGAPPACHLFAKVFKTSGAPADIEAKRQRVAHDFASTRRAHEAMAGEVELAVVPPVACYPDLLAVVTEEVSGSTLGDHLRERARWFPSATTRTDLQATMMRVGRWVRAFQGIDSGPAVTVEAIREYVDVRLARMVQHAGGGFGEPQRARVLAHVECLGAQVPGDQWRQVLVHSDLALGNVLVSHGRIVVLDLAMTRLGLALHDLARTSLLIELLGLKPQMRPATVHLLRQALLAGYDPELTPERPLFRLMTLVHRINNYGSLLRRRTGAVESLYNRLVCRNHQRWLDAELAREHAA